MKKLILNIAIVLVIGMFTAACGQNTEADKSAPASISNSAESTATTSSTAESLASSASSTVEQQPTDASKLDSLVEYFKSNGITIGAKSEKLAAMIGAKDGFAIEMNGEKIELYEYDLGSKEELTVTSLKTAKDGYIDMSGIKINVILNNDLLLAGYDEHPDKDKITQLFKDYK